MTTYCLKLITFNADHAATKTVRVNNMSNLKSAIRWLVVGKAYVEKVPLKS